MSPDITWTELRPDRNSTEKPRMLTVRMLRDFYARVEIAAAREKVSLNTYCLTAIERFMEETK
jgi:predicted HicB family RNase H-like nuclease